VERRLLRRLDDDAPDLLVGESSAPALLGSLVLDRGSRLFATRFDGARAYVTTYFQWTRFGLSIFLIRPTQPSLAAWKSPATQLTSSRWGIGS